MLHVVDEMFNLFFPPKSCKIIISNCLLWHKAPLCEQCVGGFWSKSTLVHMFYSFLRGVASLALGSKNVRAGQVRAARNGGPRHGTGAIWIKCIWHKPKSNDFMRGKNRWKIRNVDPKSCDVPAGRHRKTVKLKYCRHKEGWTPLVYLGRCLLPRSLFGRGLGAGMMQFGSSIIGCFGTWHFL